jgi:hypothetical protein
MTLKEGLLVDRRWLLEQGFDRPAVDYFLRSGKLAAVGRGVYRKPGPPLKWQNVVYSLSQLGYHVHVGHLSALKHHKFHHFLKLGLLDAILLYSNRKLPVWLSAVIGELRFQEMHRNPFKDNLSLGLQDVPFGAWDWPIVYATPERASIELLSTITSVEEIRQADLMLEGAVSFRPEMLQALLEECKQVKAKRLFLWMARGHNHSWYRRIDQKNIDLGSGKRQIVQDGVLDSEFMITVPREDDSGQEEPLF